MSLGRCLLGITLTLVLLLSACLGPASEEFNNEFGDQFSEPAMEVVTETRSFDGEVEDPGLLLESTRVSPEWTFTLEPGSSNLELELQWGSFVNDYTFVLERPDGVAKHGLDSDVMEEVPGDSFEYGLNLSDATPGEYTAYLVAEGILVEDTFSLDARWEMLVGIDEGETGTGNLTAVTFEKQGDAWQATLPYRSAGDVTDPLTLDVDTFNGRVEVVHTSDEKATAWIHAWARADSKERAEELTRSLDITLTVGEDHLKAHAKEGRETDRNESESVGATVYLEVPVGVEGSIKTGNGGIELDGLTVSDLDVKSSNGGITADLETSGSLLLDTSNGPIDAALVGSGDIKLDTSNGPIDLDLEPTGTTSLDVDSSNGGLELNLEESSDIGYELDASTGNGKITEQMDEASLEGEDKEATLRTSDLDSRSILVTGNVETSNGSVKFIGN